MLKAYKYRIYPTKTQITLIEKHFGSCRFFLYNYFLDYRQKKYAKGNKKVSYNTTQAELTKLKKLDEYKWLNECGINIRNYGIGQLDNRNTAGTVEIQACGVSSDGVVVYNTATSYDMMKQETQSSLVVG